MTQLIKTSTMAIVIAAILGSLLGAVNDAQASGYGEWTVGYTDGCGYYLDASGAATAVACPRADNGLDFYVASGDQWVYALSIWWLAEGGTAIYYQGVLYSDAYNSASTGYVGGGDSNIVDPVIYAIGAPNWSSLTFNPAADGLMTNLNNGVIDGWTPPTCLYVTGNLCYY